MASIRRDKCDGAATIDVVDVAAVESRGMTGTPRAFEVVDGAPTNADGEFSEPDLELTAFQQSVDQEKINRHRKLQSRVRIVFFLRDSRCARKFELSEATSSETDPHPGRPQRTLAREGKR